ncbi:hypothetical protein K488DRAFT_82688 [Vararia minispora EC-137]|uniref:Uncharacterized protein n=1 Tax=Vararia minispora EC-137 TaxID=1314806 RepID=A0ACB8QVC3_9AGAM|nr:hypothetical protein K488DRAFT_82688 [Vararia minispora EC-137]
MSMNILPLTTQDVASVSVEKRPLEGTYEQETTTLGVETGVVEEGVEEDEDAAGTYRPCPNYPSACSTEMGPPSGWWPGQCTMCRLFLLTHYALLFVCAVFLWCTLNRIIL